MGNGENNNNLLMTREGGGTNLRVNLMNGAQNIAVVSSIGVITQNLWLTVISRYSTWNRVLALSVNGVVSTSSEDGTLTDRTVCRSWMGRSNWAQDAFLNADIAGLFVVDEYLDTLTTTAITNAIIRGQDLTSIDDLCSCNAGYTGPDSGASKGQCTTCPPGTYKATGGSATCTFCPANTYSAAVQATTNSTCLACPVNSVAVPGSTQCLCDVGYTGEMASCAACPAGKYKRVTGTSACITCPANTVAVNAATTVCVGVAGFSGLGYPLEDVARSCGSTLTETCKTLSNGATSNAGGTTDGALDGSVSTFVSVAFNPNLARSCGSTGTQACVASNAPLFQGAPSLGNDGDTNTATRSQYGTANLPYITPYWSVDFGRSTSVFAVKILIMLAYGQDGWVDLKDFKITVGDSPVWSAADGKTPLNTVCADYLTGAGRSYVTFTCEDTVRGRYLHVVGGPHVFNYVTISEIAVEAFNYTANPALMQPWWAVDFEVERAVASVVIQASLQSAAGSRRLLQASTTLQVRVGHSTDPFMNTVCASGAILSGANNTITCPAAMAGRYMFVVAPANSVMVLNEVRVIGAAAAPCASGTYKSAVGNTNCTACPAFGTSVISATSITQCSCRAGYLDVWS